MIRDLMSIKEDMAKIYEYFDGETLAKIKLAASHWEFMELFYDAFLPCYNLTIKLQKSNVGLGISIDILNFYDS